MLEGHDEGGRAVASLPLGPPSLPPPPPPPPHPAATSARAPMAPTSAPVTSLFLTLPPLSLVALPNTGARFRAAVREYQGSEPRFQLPSAPGPREGDDAGGGTRTHTGLTPHEILNLARIPVSPLRRSAMIGTIGCGSECSRAAGIAPA